MSFKLGDIVNHVTNPGIWGQGEVENITFDSTHCKYMYEVTWDLLGTYAFMYESELVLAVSSATNSNGIGAIITPRKFQVGDIVDHSSGNPINGKIMYVNYSSCSINTCRVTWPDGRSNYYDESSLVLSTSTQVNQGVFAPFKLKDRVDHFVGSFYDGEIVDMQYDPNHVPHWQFEVQYMSISKCVSVSSWFYETDLRPHNNATPVFKGTYFLGGTGISYTSIKGGLGIESTENIKSSEVNFPKCECGKEKHGFASHSNWCVMAEKG